MRVIMGNIPVPLLWQSNPNGLLYDLAGHGDAEVVIPNSSFLKDCYKA